VVGYGDATRLAVIEPVVWVGKKKKWALHVFPSALVITPGRESKGLKAFLPGAGLFATATQQGSGPQVSLDQFMQEHPFDVLIRAERVSSFEVSGLVLVQLKLVLHDDTHIDLKWDRSAGGSAAVVLDVLTNSAPPA
jgi:hypothetical protein